MKIKVEYTMDINDSDLLYTVNAFVNEYIDSEREYKSLSEVPMDIIKDTLLDSGLLEDELKYGIDNNLLNIIQESNESLSDTRFY